MNVWAACDRVVKFKSHAWSMSRENELNGTNTVKGLYDSIVWLKSRLFFHCKWRNPFVREQLVKTAWTIPKYFHFIDTNGKLSKICISIQFKRSSISSVQNKFSKFLVFKILSAVNFVEYFVFAEQQNAQLVSESKKFVR